MSLMQRLIKVFEEAKDKDKKVLIPYITAGFPDKERFWEILSKLSLCGAGIIEIGVPFSDPIADGPIIEETSYKCLQEGVSLDWILKNLKKFRDKIKAELVLMGYCNPFEKYGWDRLAKEASELDISGFIVPDLPLEESDYVERYLSKEGIALIRLIGLNTPEDRMIEYAKRAEGFVYFVSVLGTTGPRDNFSEELVVKLETARKIFDQPIALGFGAKHPDQFVKVWNYIDGIVFGSSLILHIKNNGEVERFMKTWNSFVDKYNFRIA